MARNTAMLTVLEYELNGSGFWALIYQDQLISLDLVTRGKGSDPNFAVSEAPAFSETYIHEALKRREAKFVQEAVGDRSTILFLLNSGRGHDLGWIGFTIPGHSTSQSPETIRSRFAALAATL